MNVNNRKILLYGCEQSLTDKIYEVLNRNHINAGTLDDSCLEMTMENLLQEELHMRTIEREEKLLFFSGFAKEEIPELNSVLRENGAEFTGMLASLTQNNKDWTLRHLLDEISREHAVVQKMQGIEILLKSFTAGHIQAMKDCDDQESLKLLMETFMLLQSGTDDMGALEETESRLKGILDKYERTGEQA